MDRLNGSLPLTPIDASPFQGFGMKRGLFIVPRAVSRFASLALGFVVTPLLGYGPGDIDFLRRRDLPDQ
jgi:hypothetical protein